MDIKQLLFAIVLLLSSAAYGQESSEENKLSAEFEKIMLIAEQGDAVAQVNLGGMYEFARGVPQSYAEAAKWYRLAAEQRDASGQFNLGAMYDLGRGVPKNNVGSTHLS